MILVGQYDSPFVRRVAISLHLLGMAFTRNTISVFADADEMRRINPLGRIPSLMLDDGEVLVDSIAILDHLDEIAGPARALMPARGAERRAAWQIVSLASGAIEKAGAVVYERALRPADRQYEPWIERCVVQRDSALAALEALPQSPWLLGARLTQADITAACMVGYIKLRTPEVLAGGRYPMLNALSDRAEALPAFQAARPAADEVMPATPAS